MYFESWFTEITDNEEEEYAIDQVHYHENFNIGPYLNNDIVIITIK